MIDDAEGQSALGLLFQILLQEIARDRLQFNGCEVGDEMFADAIARHTQRKNGRRNHCPLSKLSTAHRPCTSFSWIIDPCVECMQGKVKRPRLRGRDRLFWI